MTKYGKILKYIGNGLFITGIVLCVYVLADIFIVKSRLPDGACQVIKNRPLIYTSIVMCGISIVLSFFETKSKSENQ